MVDARLLSLTSPARLEVAIDGGELSITVRGVREDPLCQPDRRLSWARRILIPGTALQLGPPDRWGGRSVQFSWQGNSLDWGFLLLRAGQVLPGGMPDDSTRLPPAYSWAAREARAEGRGLWSECGRLIQRFRHAAEASGVPPAVLYGIAMTESGLAGSPWPWTLNVAGEAQRYPSRRAAWLRLADLAAHGIGAIDIGLMQVNLHYHGFRFRSLWEALDPDINTAVAAAIVREEWSRRGTLAAAIARYHSPDPEAGRVYLQRVAAFARRAGATGDSTAAAGADVRAAQP